MPAATRSYATGNFQLTLDGVKCGFPKSLEGGGVSAEVISVLDGTSPFAHKHIGSPRYEEFSIQFGSAMDRTLFDWIAATWAGKFARKNGSIIAVNQKLEMVSQRDFFNALITETTFPALDAASRNPVYLTLKFAPEYTRNSKASGKVTGAVAKQQKLWLPSNFRLTLGDLDCSKVSKVDAFTIKQALVTERIGDSRDHLREPGRIEFPNLRITLAESGAQSWLDWFDDFVIKGNNDGAKEKSGSLSLLSPNQQEVLARVNLFNVGIFKLASEKAEANSDQIKRVTAEVYCEQMEFQLAPADIKPIGARSARLAAKTVQRRPAGLGKTPTPAPAPALTLRKGRRRTTLSPSPSN